MSVSKKLKWKRCLSKLRYVTEELEYVKDASATAASEFEAYYRRFCANKNINIAELDKQHSERLEKLYGRPQIADENTDDESEIDSIGDTSIIIHEQNPNNNTVEYEETADDKAIHEAFSKLFKQIALKLHPDRVSKSLPPYEVQMRVSMFQKVNQAFEDKKYYILLDAAEKYNITTPKNYEQQIRWMNKETDTVAQEINKQKNTYNYCFTEAETDEDRDILIRKFLQQLFRMSI